MIQEIISYGIISEKGIFTLKKSIREFLGFVENSTITITLGHEILLTQKEGGVKLTIQEGYRVKLPSYVLEKLEFQGKIKICFIERINAVAIKRFEIQVVESEKPTISDFESQYKVTRRINTFRHPENIYQILKEQKNEYKLKFDPKIYWQKKRSFNSWKASKLLDLIIKDEELIRNDLIQERLATQLSNGSWDNNLLKTAKNLRELAELGLNSNYPKAQQTISWLISRPESQYNPGMFFLYDELVQEQLDVIESRTEQTSGPKERFRNRPKSELNQITAVDPLYFNPCGQRIMWANAIVMEALLSIGYEFHERIQTAMETLSFGKWCECHYQHGISDWKRKEPLTDNEITIFEKQVLFEFTHCGIHNIKQLSRKFSSKLKRVKEITREHYKEYELRLPLPQQGCEYITVGALHKVINERLKRLVNAHLYRFAILLYNSLMQPQLAKEMEKYSITIYFQLQAISKHDSLPAKLAIYFALPWIIDNQNEDGSWGKEEYKESATLAVLDALNAIRFNFS